jgi:hypothetical protein
LFGRNTQLLWSDGTIIADFLTERPAQSTQS